jgi:hypothetical protein
MKFPVFTGVYAATVANNAATTIPPFMSVHTQILPYVEQAAAYSSVSVNTTNGNNIAIKIFLDPTDPTASTAGAGATSYAWNPLVFGNTSVSFTNLNTINDGTTNTIMAAQRFNACATATPTRWHQFGSVANNPPTYTAGDHRAMFMTSAGAQVGVRQSGAPQCTLGRAQTGLVGGLLVSLCDASVRSVQKSLAEATGTTNNSWFAICSPASGEVPPTNW